MKITRNQLKELVRNSIYNTISEEDDSGYVHVGYGKYKKKGQEKNKDAPTFEKDDSGKFQPIGGDVGGPSHPNVPKKEPSKPKITKISADPFDPEKPEDEPSDMDTEKPDGDDEIEKISQIRKRGVKNQDKFGGPGAKPGESELDKPLQKFNIHIDGEDKPLTVTARSEKAAKQAAHAGAYPSKIKISKIEPEGEEHAQMDTGGPSYANIPKGVKTSADAKKEKEKQDYLKWLQQQQAKEKKVEPLKKGKPTAKTVKALAKANNTVAKDLGFLDTKGVFKNGNSDDIDEFINHHNIPDLGQDFDQADELLNYVRDNEQGVRDDDYEVVQDYKKQIWKLMSTPKQDKPSRPGVSDMGESIKESKRRRFTVKEVQKWMKTLEENRYKRVYNSDCRRVSWMVNNMNEDVANMPKSMRKKWTKAQYGRERYLAKEFLKSKKQKMMENKLRKMIKEILTEAPKDIHHSQAKFFWVHKSDIKKASKLLLKKFPPKGGYHRIEIAGKTGRVSGHFAITTDKRTYNDALELLAKNRIKVRG